MYIPARFAETDLPTLFAFIEEHGFATFVTDDLDATHLPLLVDRNRKVLQGHFARANPQWKALNGVRMARAIFLGPHAYISPAWYGGEKPAVPTWNYATVHVTGSPVLVDDSNWLNSFLDRLVQKYESSHNQPWAYSPPADFHTAMVSQIVGFEMPIETIEGKFKLSQNRSQQDQAGVIAGLESEGGSQVASLMRERQ